MKKKIGFFILLAGAVAALIAIFLYGSSFAVNQNVYIALGIAVGIAAIAAFAADKAPKIFNWGPAVASAATGAALAMAATVMSDCIGYVISGLYQASELSAWITFSVVAGVALVLFVIAGFTGVASEE